MKKGFVKFAPGDHALGATLKLERLGAALDHRCKKKAQGCQGFEKGGTAHQIATRTDKPK